MANTHHRWVAIFYRKTLDIYKPRGLKLRGYSWASLIVKLKRGYKMNLVTSYTPHGEDAGVTQTVFGGQLLSGPV
eukprot:7144377-Karenia_brevis.AAC.1